VAQFGAAQAFYPCQLPTPCFLLPAPISAVLHNASALRRGPKCNRVGKETATATGGAKNAGWHPRFHLAFRQDPHPASQGAPDPDEDSDSDRLCMRELILIEIPCRRVPGSPPYAHRTCHMLFAHADVGP